MPSSELHAGTQGTDGSGRDIYDMLQQIPRDDGGELYRFACRKLLLYKVERILTNDACAKTVEQMMAFLSEDI